MPLPILHDPREPSREDLVRLFHQTETRWTEAMAEGELLDVGMAYANPGLPRVRDANHIRDAALGEGISPEQASTLVEEHYAARGVRCRGWVMNPSALEAQTSPLVEHLLGQGYRPRAADVLRLERQPTRAAEAGGLTIIPARASYRHFRTLAEEWARGAGEPQLADAAMLHLDDPHWEALLALKEGVAVGCAGVLTMGEVGRIDEVYVAEAHRRQGIGRTLMGRVLEICARAQFRHVMLSVVEGNAGALALYEKLGFARVGRIVSYGMESEPST